MTLREFYFTCCNISRDTEIILSLNYGTEKDSFVCSLNLRGTVDDFFNFIDTTDKYSRLAKILREQDISSFSIANGQQIGWMISTVDYVTFLDNKKSCKQEVAKLFGNAEGHFEADIF